MEVILTLTLTVTVILTVTVALTLTVSVTHHTHLCSESSGSNGLRPRCHHYVRRAGPAPRPPTCPPPPSPPSQCRWRRGAYSKALLHGYACCWSCANCCSTVFYPEGHHPEGDWSANSFRGQCFRSREVSSRRTWARTTALSLWLINGAGMVRGGSGQDRIENKDIRAGVRDQDEIGGGDGG